jgi:hypothetical protein
MPFAATPGNEAFVRCWDARVTFADGMVRWGLTR